MYKTFRTIIVCRVNQVLRFSLYPFITYSRKLHPHTHPHPHPHPHPPPQDQSFMSPGSPAKSAHSPLKSSQHLHLHLQSPDKSGPRGSTGSGAEAGATFIPFAQRQAKSQVAAREILKKGQKVSAVVVAGCLYLCICFKTK